MRDFTNPLDNIRVASPCSANWDEMFGDDRKRFCGDCKLNVYNLSGMTRRQAESLIISSEGRLCVRFFRRADGTVLTKNCPIGWAAVKQRVSRIATAAFSMIAGLFSGIFAFNLLESGSSYATMGTLPAPYKEPIMGDVAPYPVTQGGISPATDNIDIEIEPGRFVNGRMTIGKPMIVVKPAARRK